MGRQFPIMTLMPVTNSIILVWSQIDSVSLIQVKRNEKALIRIKEKIMHARSILYCSQSNNISCCLLFLIHSQWLNDDWSVWSPNCWGACWQYHWAVAESCSCYPIVIIYCYWYGESRVASCQKKEITLPRYRSYFHALMHGFFIARAKQQSIVISISASDFVQISIPSDICRLALKFSFSTLITLSVTV